MTVHNECWGAEAELSTSIRRRNGKFSTEE